MEYKLEPLVNNNLIPLVAKYLFDCWAEDRYKTCLGMGLVSLSLLIFQFKCTSTGFGKWFPNSGSWYVLISTHFEYFSWLK